MAEISANGDFREAVCIDGGRVYDSCCDRDCLDDIEVYFSPKVDEMIARATTIRCKCAEVENVYIDVEPVHLNRGYYSCDLTFFFLLKFDLFMSQHSSPVSIEGVAFYNKKVILYGSEGKVKVFSNEYALDCENDNQASPRSNLPKCVVECVDPIPLSAVIKTVCNSTCHCPVPRRLCDKLGGEIRESYNSGEKTVFVTLGLFTIVQLIRNVQMLIPVYDFCIPEKECSNSTDNPCEVFSRLDFPTDDFFPPRESRGGICGCNNSFSCSKCNKDNDE